MWFCFDMSSCLHWATHYFSTFSLLFNFYTCILWIGSYFPYFLPLNPLIRTGFFFLNFLRQCLSFTQSWCLLMRLAWLVDEESSCLSYQYTVLELRTLDDTLGFLQTTLGQSQVILLDWQTFIFYRLKYLPSLRIKSLSF